MASNTRFMNPPTIAKPGGYSHVVEITGPGRIIYIAGQLGLKPNGDIAGDFRAQVVQAFENLKSALAAVGAGFLTATFGLSGGPNRNTREYLKLCAPGTGST